LAAVRVDKKSRYVHVSVRNILTYLLTYLLTNQQLMCLSGVTRTNRQCRDRCGSRSGKRRWLSFLQYSSSDWRLRTAQCTCEP